MKTLTPSLTMPRRRVLGWAAGSLTLGGAAWPRARAAAPAPAPCEGRWPLWQGFVNQFVQDDGRVIDDQFQTRYTTSEGQAYALFFSLVADERERFDVLLRWTEQHLAQGDLRARLPGWRWGRDDRGQWRLIDTNPASDADLWLSHTLFEAARLWKAPAYRETAQALLQRVRQEAVVTLPEVGAMLLPAPAGFHEPGPGGGIWRLNPSYLPLHQLRAFAREDPQGPWAEIADNTLLMLRAAGRPAGFAPNWFSYSLARGWHAGPLSPAVGSYDAVRTYLWAGLLHPADPLKAPLMAALRGMREWLARGERAPPQEVRTDTGREVHPGRGPAGFSAALLPYLQAGGPGRLLALQAERVAAATRPAAGRRDIPPSASASAAACRGELVGEPPTYFDQVLSLFGLGAMEGRYAFSAEGALVRPAVPLPSPGSS